MRAEHHYEVVEYYIRQALLTNQEKKGVGQGLTDTDWWGNSKILAGAITSVPLATDFDDFGTVVVVTFCNGQGVGREG